MLSLTRRIISAASDIMQISTEDITSSLLSESVDARHTCMRLLYEQGATTRQIAQSFNLSRRAVSYALTNYSHRLSQSPRLRRMYEVIRQRIGNELY